MAEQGEQGQQVDLQALVNFVEGASARMATQDEQIKALTTRLEEATAEPAYEPRAEMPVVSEEDVESMSNAQLLGHMETRFNAALNNTIGGLNPSARNVISGNNASGVGFFNNATGNVVQGNFIGTDVNGTADLGNSADGVTFSFTSSGNTIGPMWLPPPS